MTINVQSHFLDQNAKLREALVVLEQNDVKIVLVVDAQQKLIGTITDGDIRRAIMRNISLDDPAASIITKKPATMPQGSSKVDIIAGMHKARVEQMILVDPAGSVVDIKTLDLLEKPLTKENWVVLMAGGLGTRLRPLTEDMPKPMLKIGGSPILEILINNFKNQGFTKFYICINYRGDIIRDYFGDGSAFDVEIRYIQESKPLGTAGALSLIEELPQQPVFVVNGDIITSLNFTDMLKFHTEHRSAATMAIREHSMQVPYGVVEVQDYKIHHFIEKPTHTYFVNAGIYLIEPAVIKLLEPNEPCVMPALFEKVKKAHKPIFAFPIREYWIDIGQIEDYERANQELS
jgi:dTDP-glucose pyrophosphorylase